MRTVFALVAVAGCALSATAAIDTLSPEQAALGPFASQNTQSSFGGNNVLAGAYASVSGGTLNLVVTGRVNNGNERVVVFVDNGSGGGAAVLPGGLFGFGGGAAGMIFDAGFAPQTAIVANGDSSSLFVDYNTNIGGTPSSVFAGLNARSNPGSPLSFAGGGAPDIRCSMNDSFGGGEFGFGALSGGAAASYAASNTGVGMQIPLSALGISSDYASFRMMVMILGGDGQTISNQILGAANGVGSPFGSYPAANALDLNQIQGAQFFTVPVPSAAGLMGLAALAAGRRRR